MTDQEMDAPPVEHMISYRVSRLQSLLNSQATRLLANHGGITPTQWRVLLFIQVFGTTTNAAIARQTRLDKALLSRAIRGLVARKLVRFEPSAANKTHRLLTMTEKGLDTYLQALPAMQKRHDNLVNCLSNGEMEVFFAAMTKLETELRSSLQDL